MLQAMGSQRVGHDLATEQQQIENKENGRKREKGVEEILDIIVIKNFLKLIIDTKTTDLRSLENNEQDKYQIITPRYIRLNVQKVKNNKKKVLKKTKERKKTFNL